MTHYPINLKWEELFPRPKSGKHYYNAETMSRTSKPGLSEMRGYDKYKGY